MRVAGRILGVGVGGIFILVVLVRVVFEGATRFTVVGLAIRYTGNSAVFWGEASVVEGTSEKEVELLAELVRSCFSEDI